MLSEEHISKFIVLYKKNYGIELDKKTAIQELRKLLIIVKAGIKQKARASPKKE